MAQASSFRSGMVLEIDGDLWSISEAQLIQPGKGGAFVRTKLKNMKTERVVEKTFRSEEKVKDVRIEKKSMQFLYSDGENYYFMDQTSYEQVTIDKDFLGDVINFLLEGNNVDILFHEVTPVGIELPYFVNLKVVETEPGMKGDTVSGATKIAKLETGAAVQVPLFIEEGEVLKIDTRINEYVERVKA
ncbi:MAG TPA: elongation factor P [Bacteroidetes bacterium]|nr:elongation factor P [Bacteroidota bacterium]